MFLVDTYNLRGVMDEQVLDHRIGAAVKVFRERAGISQQDLAAHMKDAGHRWAQATVWGVESGSRPLRLSEAAALSQMFGVSIGHLAGEPNQQSIPSLVLEDATRAIQTLQDAIKAVAA